MNSSRATVSSMRRRGRSSTASTRGWARRSGSSCVRATPFCSGARPMRCSNRHGRCGRWKTTPPFFNDTKKYVVSSTINGVTWRNSTILGPYSPDAVRRLKADVAGGIYISGSGTLVHALLADGLVDELHLCLYPLTRGSGPRLFVDGAAACKWSLAADESYENGALYLKYATT